MLTLKDFKNDINKCSKCAMCQAVCPIYKITGNDCAVSRGKFVMLQGVLNGDLKLNKNIIKYLDMCSKCGKCKDFCPSNIDICKIFETTKYQYAKNDFFSKIIFTLESRKIFNNILQFFDKITHLNKKQTKTFKNTKNILYFKGCADKISPNNEFATKKILEKYNLNIIEKEFDCCGVPFLSSGNLERFEQAQNTNAEILKNTQFDYIITNCASCEDSLKTQFPQYNINNIVNFIAQNPKTFIFNKPLRVTFHKPCHLKNIDFLTPLLENCENITYIEMKDFDDCCGFAGEFALKNPKLSNKLMQNKAKNILKTKADIVLTLCPACEIGLKLGLLGKKNSPKVMNIATFLDLAKKIV